jgi:hypothetical protein
MSNPNPIILTLNKAMSVGTNLFGKIEISRPVDENTSKK